jgi:hypothetical protein
MASMSFLETFSASITFPFSIVISDWDSEVRNEDGSHDENDGEGKEAQKSQPAASSFINRRILGQAHYKTNSSPD